MDLWAGLATMRYLVTGASGLLGNNIVRQLVDRGDAVRVLIRSTSNRRAIAGLPLEIAEGDVTDRASVQRACRDVDTVIHAAGDVYIGWHHRERSFRVNVEGTRHMATSAREVGARLVHVSTINALGLGKFENPATEETALPGIVECHYVTSKRAADDVVREEVSRGLWAAIVHPSLIFGPYDWKPSSGKMLIGVSQFSLWSPTGANNVADARDVARGVILAGERGTSCRDYILGGTNIWYFDFWGRIAKIAGKPVPRIPMGPLFRFAIGGGGDLIAMLTRQEQTANSAMLGMSAQQHCFDSSRAKNELGYTIRPLDETLRDTWDWMVAEGYIKT